MDSRSAQTSGGAGIMKHHLIKIMHIAAALIILLFCSLYASAQDELEPTDPDIVIPSVIMEVEDLSIDLIIAELPEEEWALPAERDVPLPEVILPVEEPEIDFDFAEEEDREDEDTPSLFVESVLGGGNISHLFAQVQINKLGDFPRYSMFFTHETLDGFSFKDTGTGYSSREEQLKGSIKYNIRKLQMENNMNYHEFEHGLQEQGDYFSKISRNFSSLNNFSISPTDIFTLSGSLYLDYSTFLLTDNSAPDYEVDYPPREIISGIGIGTDFRIRKALLGINAEYKFRNIIGENDFLLHRFLGGVSLSFELPHWLNIGGKVSYYYSKQTPVLIPFEASFWGTPLDFFSFKIRGGYFLNQMDLNTFISKPDYIYSDMPDNIYDNYGWFAALNAQFNLRNSFTISLNQELMFHQNLPQLGDDINSSTGLFPVYFEDDAVELENEARLTWNAPKIFSLSVINSNTFLWDPNFSATGEFSVETAFREKRDKYGVIITGGVKTNFEDELKTPILDLNTYVQIADFARVILELNDILYFINDDYRFFREPFITPGFLGTLKIQIKF
jgi:hypothetical protein